MSKDTISRNQASDVVKKLVEDMRDVLKNEEAWAIGERFKGTIEDQYAHILAESRKEKDDTKNTE